MMSSLKPEKTTEEIDGWEDEIPEPSWKKRVFQILVALLFIGGIIYLYGIYQFTFLTRTDAPDVPREYQSILSEETVTLPLVVTIFEQSDLLGSYRDEVNVEELVRHADAIWDQADIDLVLQEINRITISEDDERRFVSGPRQFIADHVPQEEHGVSVVLVRTLQGINGVAFGGSETIAVADYTSFSDYRTLAHEVGHVLGLTHTTDVGRLMATGGRGTTLTEVEAREAYLEAAELLE